MKRNNNSARVAMGAMLTALSVVILIPSALEVFVYALPAIAGMLIVFAILEMGSRWAITVYISTSAIALITVPNKEAVMLYVAFFGYYPVLKAFLESKMKRPVEYAIKFAVFNASMIGAYLFMIHVFGMPYEKLMGIDGEIGEIAKHMPKILLGLGNIVFILFDKGVTNVISLYVAVWQKKFRKLFKF